MSCCYYSDDLPKIFNAKEIIARIPHTCCECGRTVQVGEIYENATGLWDGSWATYKTCEKCADIRESVSATVCTNFGELYDSYEYLVGQEVADKVFNRTGEPQ